MKSYLYILPNVGGTRFKVGKANDILRRAKSFGWNEVDFQGSFGLELESEEQAFKLERVLHLSFSEFRLKSVDVRSEGGRRDGSSEWFSVACRERLEKLISDMIDLFPYRLLAGRDLAERIKRQMTPSDSMIEKKKRRDERDAMAAKKKEAHDTQLKLAAAELDRALVQIADRLMVELTNQFDAATIVGVCEEHSILKVVLAAAGNLGHDIWRLEPSDCFYKSSNVQGGLICPLVRFDLLGAQFLMVPLDLGTRETEWRNRIFKRHVEFFQSLPQIDRSTLELVFSSTSGVEEEIQSDRVTAVKALARRLDIDL